MLLDDVMKDGLKEENDPHPQEGVLMGNVFLRVEDEIKDQEHEIPKRGSDGEVIEDSKGEPVMETVTVPTSTGRFMLMRYNGVTEGEIIHDTIVDGEEIVKDSWDAAVHYFDKQVKVLKGGMDQDELDEEIKNREVTGEEAEIDHHSTKAAPSEYHVECQVNDCCHMNTITSLEDGQTCDSCGEDLDIKELQEAAATAIEQARLAADPADDDEAPDSSTG